MKKLTVLLLTFCSLLSFGQQWTAISSFQPATFKTTLLTTDEAKTTVRLQVPGFYTFEVNTPRGNANVIYMPKAVSTSEAGEPGLPMIAIPAIIGDQQHYSIKVVSADYLDYAMDVAPSKGDFSRQIDPAEVPFTYGDMYEEDAFYPSEQVGLYEPYILRDFRGQNMVIYPFAYNPVAKTLRVYFDMTVELYADGAQGENTMTRKSGAVKLDPEIKALYGNHFINYTEATAKYNPVDETGELLIICHDPYMSAMQPFVNWKKQIGRPTTMVGTSTAGTTSEAIKAYVQSQYNANNNISHVLLVGDYAHIQGYYAYNGSYSGRSDNWFGQVAGNDYYNDLIVGRFSAETENDVITQVNKVLYYERDINQTDTWLNTGTGVATVAGSGGHFGEDDWQHVDNLRNDLLAYTYTEVYRDYASGGGANSNAATLSSHINAGVSIINYCNHGSETSWGVFGYSNSNVNALTNVNKLPFIWSVACLNGKYDYYQPCFAEAWLRANNGNNVSQPTGAIGGMFSYINQPWVPPMYGQDEMVDVLVESDLNNIKRTLGGVSFDGNMKIIDQYGSNNSQGMGTYMCWILFGDPSLTLRTSVPTNMNVTHAPTMSTTATSFTVNAPNGNGALATLTRNNEIMGSATINNGSCNITFTAPGQTGEATLTVFGYNKVTYVGTVNITSGGTQSYNIAVLANPAEGGNVTGGGSYNQGQQCTVSASPKAGYNFTNWTENGNVVSTNTSYSFTVTGNRNLVANFVAQPQNYTISVSASPANGGTVTGAGSYQEGQTCTVVATANTGYNFQYWTENGSTVSTSASYTFTVTGNRNLVAVFTQQTFAIATIASPAEGGSVTGGGTFNYGQSCTLTASPAVGYDFVAWRKGTQQVSVNPTYTFMVTESATYTAIFQIRSYNINLVANPSEGGVVTGNGNFNHGQVCTINAMADRGYNFVNWSEDGNVLSDQATYSFTVTGDRTLTANFELQTYDILVTLDPEEGASITGAGYYVFGEEVVLTVVPNEHYRFENWTENGEVVSEEPTYIFHAERNRDLVAHLVNTLAVADWQANIQVYPSPTSGKLHIEGANIRQIQVFNALGQKIYATMTEGENLTIDLSQYGTGVYMIRLTDNQGQVTVRKTVVE